MKFKLTIGDTRVPDNISVDVSYGADGEPATYEFGLSSFFSRSLRERGTDPFTHINRYLSTLPWSVKKNIIAYYTHCAEAFSTIPYPDELSRKLALLTKDFFTTDLVTNVTNWMKMNCSVAVPDEFTNTFDTSDGKPFTLERTYIRDDYVALAGFSMTSRFMLPIWSEFANIHQQKLGESYWGYECLQLLRASNVFECEALVKVRNYITSNFMESDTYRIILPSIIADGCGSENYINLIMGDYIVKRLPMHDVTNPELSNLVVIAYSDATGRRQMNIQGSTRFGDGIKIKDPKANQNDDSPDSMSAMETLRVKAEYPMGPIVAHEQYARNIHEVAMRLLRTDVINTELLNILNSSIKREFNSERIPEHTIILTKWVISSVIHPTAIGLMKRDIVLDVISVVQFYLITKRHNELALLFASKYNKVSGSLQGGGGTLDRIPQELSTQIAALVPHQHITLKRNKTEPPNRAIQSVDLLAKMLISNDWVLTLPRDIVKELTGREGGMRHRTPSSVAIHLGNLAIEIGENIKASISNKGV